MNCLGPIFFILGLTVVATIIVVDARDKPRRDADAAAKADVLLDGEAVTVHILADRRQGRMWRVIYVDRGVVVIPGSEKTLAVEKP